MNAGRHAEVEMRVELNNLEPMNGPTASRLSIGENGDGHVLFLKVGERSVTIHTDRESLLKARDMLDQYLGLHAPVEPEEKPLTTGHCIHKNQIGGCQLHNLHCGYPRCDTRKVGE